MEGKHEIRIYWLFAEFLFPFLFIRDFLRDAAEFTLEESTVFAVDDFHFLMTLGTTMVGDFWFFSAAIVTLAIAAQIDFPVSGVTFFQLTTAFWADFRRQGEVFIGFLGIFDLRHQFTSGVFNLF